MTWRQRYQQGSLGGAPFKLKRADTEVGRQTIEHVYPTSDGAWGEDMHALADHFTLNFITIGPDYDKERDALIAVCKKKGPHVLVHPLYGRRNVMLLSTLRISESPSDEGGIARFTLQVFETNDNVEPTATQDTRTIVNLAADKAATTAIQDFADGFSIDGMPDFVQIGALDMAKDVMASLTDMRSSLVPDMSIVAPYMQAARGVSSSLASLLRSPADFAGQLMGLFNGIGGLASTPLGALNALRSMFGYGMPKRTTTFSAPVYSSPGLRPVSRTTPSRTREANNQEAIKTLVQRAAVIEAVRAAADVPLDSYDAAVDLRDTLSDQLDVLIETPSANTAEDMSSAEDAAVALQRLRVAMVQDITARGGDMGRVSHIQLSANMPALAVAWQFLGSSKREEDLIARNPGRIMHPSFVPGGVELEVLRDDLV